MNFSGMSGETFAALLTPCLPSVRRLVQSRLRGWDYAEDVVQQTLLQAFKHRDQLQSHSKFKSWLWSIAMNEICMFHRRSRVHAPLPESPAMEWRDWSPSPLEQFEQLERVNRVQNALSTLCERDRTAIRLRDLEGFSLAETAETLRSSEPATKSVHFRARRRLKLALSRA
ncbi:MAG TPA: sigma-70 family RNA polymerase sigma factor [Bryobacteraceae bacterium]|nr:sigma-70 family RNA polymerase sigma factor [Bryobacteraceae bacterium]